MAFIRNPLIAALALLLMRSSIRVFGNAKYIPRKMKELETKLLSLPNAPTIGFNQPSPQRPHPDV